MKERERERQRQRGEKGQYDNKSNWSHAARTQRFHILWTLENAGNRFSHETSRRNMAA
jgi:hypothetical protein